MLAKWGFINFIKNSGDFLNKKKALVLYGSPHKNGNTKKALLTITKPLETYYNFEIIDSFKENIQPCTDCGFCTKVARCKFDDFNHIDVSFRSCNLIVLATPVYNLSFPAPLKNIIDRTQLYFNMKTKLKINPFSQKKEAILIATYGSCDNSCEELLLKQVQPFFKLLNATVMRSIFISNTDLLSS